MTKTVLLALVCASLAYPQVAEKANDRYRSAEGRKGMIATLGDPHRPDQLQAGELVKNLQLKPGDTVADLGAGAGMLLPYLSKAVGTNGRVIAADIFRDFLDQARKHAEAQGLANVMYVLGTDKEPRLPENCCDVIVTVDAYHHFDYPAHTLAGVRAALRPGGRFVVVDYYKRPDAMGNGNFALEHIRIDKDAVIAEISAEGFTLAGDREHIAKRQYTLSFTRK